MTLIIYPPYFIYFFFLLDSLVTLVTYNNFSCISALLVVAESRNQINFNDCQGNVTKVTKIYFVPPNLSLSTVLCTRSKPL